MEIKKHKRNIAMTLAFKSLRQEDYGQDQWFHRKLKANLDYINNHNLENSINQSTSQSKQHEIKSKYKQNSDYLHPYLLFQPILGFSSTSLLWRRHTCSPSFLCLFKEVILIIFHHYNFTALQGMQRSRI